MTATDKLNGITFVLKGTDDGSDLVRAGDLVAFVQRLLATLTAIDVARNGRETRFYRISDLTVGSAAATVRESIEEKLRFLMDALDQDVEPAFADLLESIADAKVPHWAEHEPDVLVKFRDLTEPLTHVALASVSVASESYAFDESFRRKVETAIGQDVVTEGDLVGTIFAVNLHAHPRATLWSGKKSVACEFNPNLTEAVVASIKKRVRVHGELKRRANSEWPYGVKIHKLEQLPDEADLPLFANLYGASARFFPRDVDPVDYIREMRDADG